MPGRKFYSMAGKALSAIAQAGGLFSKWKRRSNAQIFTIKTKHNTTGLIAKSATATFWRVNTTIQRASNLTSHAPCLTIECVVQSRQGLSGDASLVRMSLENCHQYFHTVGLDGPLLGIA